MKTNFYIHHKDDDVVIDFSYGEIDGTYNCAEKKVISASSNGEQANEYSLSFVNQVVGDDLYNLGEQFSELIPSNEEEETGWIKMMIQPTVKFSTDFKLE